MPRGDHSAVWIGALASLAYAALLFTRYGIDNGLSRDESIYTYAGQQLHEGVPVYASIFDPKAPLASMLAGLGVAAGDLFGTNDLYAVRVVFFVCACLTVVAVYLLAQRLFVSSLAGFAAAVTFCSFRGFAADAIGGPDAKTPGVLFAVLAMLGMVRRRPFLSAFLAALAFLVWQPLLVYVVVSIGAAVVAAEPGRRRRASGLALAGAAVPVLVVSGYFALASALQKFIVAAFVFPTLGIERAPQPLTDRLGRIYAVARDDLGFSSWLFWGGLVTLVWLIGASLVAGRREVRRTVQDPLVLVVLPTLLGVVAFSAADFQGYPDLFPALPYAALGIGGAAAYVVGRLRAPRQRMVAVAGVVVGALVVTGAAWTKYSDDASGTAVLVQQRGDACQLATLLGPEGTLYALGDPTPLVLTHRRNPDRYIYLGSGVAQWKVDHLRGGFAGWKRQIKAAAPTAIVTRTWQGPLRDRMVNWLLRNYDRAYLGGWTLYLPSAVRLRAERAGVPLRERWGGPVPGLVDDRAVAACPPASDPVH